MVGENTMSKKTLLKPSNEVSRIYEEYAISQVSREIHGKNKVCDMVKNKGSG